MNNFKKKTFLIPATIMATYVGSANADNDRGDLDDIKLYDIVKVEQCLDAAFDTIEGHARKLEFKIEFFVILIISSILSLFSFLKYLFM